MSASSIVAAAALWLASAPTDAVLVDAPTCPGLDADEVQRLVRLELAAVTQEIREGPPLQVVLLCQADQLEISVTDPLTSKRLERTVPAPDPAPGRARVVALAISQLFAASWLELLLVEDATPPPGEPGPTASPGVQTEAVRAATKLVEDKTTLSPARPDRALELLAAAGVRGRALESAPFAALHLDLELRGWLSDTVGLAGRTDFDLGRALRSSGQVQGLAVVASAGLVWRTGPRPVALGGAVWAGGGWARLRGVAQRDEVAARARDGPTGQAMVTLGPRIRTGRLRIDIDAELGGMLRSPRGLITDEAAVSMGGIFMGAALRLGGALGPPPSTSTSSAPVSSTVP